MSEAKTAKKTKSKAKETSQADNKADNKAETKTDTKAEAKTDTKTETKDSGSSDKSASQTSISHFSSVTTKEYRSGWEEIFGNKKKTKKSKSNKANGVDLPLSLDLSDADINDDLRALLYKAFQRQARKQNISLAQLKKIADIEYNLLCDVTEKDS
ncbi:MAG: hypothetical protein HN731_14310 [Rhodospirillaceae bacterium]|jgi:hypothetical protein|nr:hypothetical protein [Rhodospirillaceae bacterium]